MRRNEAKDSRPAHREGPSRQPRGDPQRHHQKDADHAQRLQQG